MIMTRFFARRSICDIQQNQSNYVNINVKREWMKLKLNFNLQVKTMERHHHKKGHHNDSIFEHRDKHCEKKCEKPCILAKCEEPKRCEVKCAPKKCEKKCSPPKCEKKCEVKCAPKKCHKKKCSSSSSSSSDCKPCVPNVVYVLCHNGGTSAMSITAAVTTPNGSIAPFNYTCPAQIGQKIYITYTITNIGNVSLKGPIYVYDSFTGVHKVGCSKKLRAGATTTITVHGKISKCDCQAGNGISIVANAYSYS